VATAWPSRCVGTNGGKSAPDLLAEWAAGGGDAPRPSLLKRSIILAKAWCYYEAHILGAHHSLLSSYALEVFVLYVLLHYHEAVTTPLALLCTFIDVVAGFDWTGHALSLYGPVPLAAVPATVSRGAGAPPATKATAVEAIEVSLYPWMNRCPLCPSVAMRRTCMCCS
jgi:hypothetical protein